MERFPIAQALQTCGGILLVANVYLAFQSCSRERAEPRAIRAHTSLHEGVAHAEPAGRAERYCQECHGAQLAGGKAFEPSCWTCHGKNWLDEDPDKVLAPDDHNVVMGRYRHRPELFTPEAVCSECHGAQLEGTGPAGTAPGCELCHARLWEDPERRARAGL